METKSNNGHSTVTTKRRTDTGTPRWVKVFGLVGLALVVLFVVLHLTGHGMGAHDHGVSAP